MLIKDQVLMIADIPNGNGRIYPKQVIENIVYDTKDKVILGEIGMQESYEINLTKVTHQATNFRLEDNKLFCDITTFDNLKSKKGELVAKLINDGIGGFRTAGIGYIKDNVVKDDYKLIAVNYTLDPA